MTTTPCFLASLRKATAGAVGDGLGEAETGVVLALAEILGTKHLLRTNDLRALFGGLLGQGKGLGEIGLGISDAGVLQESEGDGLG